MQTHIHSEVSEKGEREKERDKGHLSPVSPSVSLFTLFPHTHSHTHTHTHTASLAMAAERMTSTDTVGTALAYDERMLGHKIPHG